jgi:hypothetical protein
MCRSLRLSAALTGLFLCALSACGGRPLIPTGDGTEVTQDASPSGEYIDAFIPGQTGNWVFEQDELGSTAIANEELVVTIAAPNTIQYATLDDELFGDFALEVDVWQRSGPPESSYGVLFRQQDDGQFYRFEVTGNGLFMIERRNTDGTWTRLVPEWTPSAGINQGLNVANRLKILATGPNLTFYANDVLLTQVSDTSLASGRIALDAGTFGGGNLQVSFDNLSITRDAP